MTITANLHRASGALTTLGNGRHVWHADLSPALDPDARAPDPHDLLDSALAACTALTLELYIRRKQWPVSDVHVSVDHVEDRDETGASRYRMQRRIQILGDIGDAERQRLLQLAAHCPIHRLLQGEVRIDTSLA